MLFKFNTAISQSGQFINFSISQQNLRFLYETEADFENPKVFSDAFTINIRNRSRRLLFSARTVSNLNQGLTVVPNNLFGIQISGSTTYIQPSYRNLYNLDFSDQPILIHNLRGNRNTRYDFDLHVAEIGYDYDPGQYFFSILFTVTEQ